jgi:hypothetical protein
MQAVISASVRLAGETATNNQTRTKDGVAGVTPEPPLAFAGTLKTRASGTAGVITAPDHDFTNASVVTLTWVDEDGNLKHRYDCAVSVSGDDLSVSVGTGDDLITTLSWPINVGLVVLTNCTFDFDAMDTFVITTNRRGVVVFYTESAEPLVVDMAANGLAMWIKDSGFPAPITGDPIVAIGVASGDPDNDFRPKVLALYDASPEYTEPYNSGQ